jgi:PAS domain S-box-containing protein
MSQNAADPRIFRSLFDAYPDGVLLVSHQGVVLLANPAVCTLLGYSAAQLQGLSVDQLVPLSVAPRHATYREGYALAPRSRPMGTELELKARHADGSEVMVEIALSPLRVGDGEQALDYVVASVRGIGAYPRVKRAMQRARYNEFVVQLGRVAVDTLDPDELMKRMPDVVAQALQVQSVGVFLISPNQLELRGTSLAGMATSEAARVVYANRPDTVAGYVVAQRAPVLINNFARENRFEVPLSLQAAGAQSGLGVPLADRGQVIGVLAAWSKQVGRFGDEEVAFLEALASLLSTSLQRTQAEQQLRHAQRMESVGELTGGIAHDFNNLLTVIQGNLQMLADLPALQADGLAPQLVAAASRAGQRGADLTGKLLAFSRRQPLAPQALDPAQMLLSLADMLRRTLGEQVHVQVEASPGLPHCLADPVQLEAALLNVAINARDAILEAAPPSGGVLILRCGAGHRPALEGGGNALTGQALTGQALSGQALSGQALAVQALDFHLAPAGQPDHHAYSQAPDVWFSVQDNGCGMSAAVRDRAFEPFFTTKEAGRGTGLGLSTVYGFVKQSHGSLQLDSTPGVGTQVTLYLPAMQAPPTQAAAQQAAEVPLNLRVLLVEDDADVRAVAQAFLAALGCQVQACATAEQALLRLAQDTATFDVLFSDITLGAGLDGIELARQVHAQQPQLAVLLCSGYSRFLSQAGAVAGGLAGGLTNNPPWPVLKKPYTQLQLAHAMAQCLSDQVLQGRGQPRPY